MIFVLAASYVKNYELLVEFSDGFKGVVDLEQVLWGPMFEPLRNQDEFQKFEISPIFKTVTWANGADLAPEFLRSAALA